MSEYDTGSYDCPDCGEFVVTIAPFETPHFGVSFCPNCGAELPGRENE